MTSNEKTLVYASVCMVYWAKERCRMRGGGKRGLLSGVINHRECVDTLFENLLCRRTWIEGLETCDLGWNQSYATSVITLEVVRKNTTTELWELEMVKGRVAKLYCEWILLKDLVGIGLLIAVLEEVRGLIALDASLAWDFACFLRRFVTNIEGKKEVIILTSCLWWVL